jgi:glutamate decarboxylase
MFTYELAPVFILMESVVLKHMRKIIGKEFEAGDSLLSPGGSMGNLYALMAARHKKFPDYKEKGLRALPGDILMFTSDCSHKSIKTCADVSGIGIRNCIMVPSDDKGRMIPSELERLIIHHKEQGQVPFFVNCTAGNIVIGSFDPLNEIADICERHNCWMHVDVRLSLLKLPVNGGKLNTTFIVGCLGRCSVVVQQIPPSKVDRN